jgi:HEAT repeat protein
MNAAALRPLFTALLASTVLAIPVASQVSHGGGPGGSYKGPGDTVPNGQPGGGSSSGGSNNPPSFGGPGDTAGGGGGAGGTTPPPLAPGVNTPPPGGGTGLLPPSEPTTPDAQPPVEDPTSWQLWWHYNRWEHLPIGRAEKMLARSSPEGFFLGRGQASEPTAPRASAVEITGIVRPALLEVLQEARRKELVVFALQALAKLREHPFAGDWNFDAAARRYLQDGNQDICEGALLALGIRGDAAWTSLLLGVLHDTEEGRKLLGRSKVGHRQRAFAAYAIALLADRVPDEIWRIEVHRRLASALPDERPEVQAAVLIAIGHCALPWKEASATGTSSTAPVTLAEQIRLVTEFLEDDDHAVVARSQAPQALALLAREAPEHLRVEAAVALQDQIGPHARASSEIRNGAVLALGAIGRAQVSPVDDAIRADLQRVVTGSGANRLTRYFALIALGQAGARPGTGDEPLAAAEPTRRFLLGQLSRSRGMQLAWTALALGLLEEGAVNRNELASLEVAAALRDVLGSSRNGDVAGAVALALGMMRDQDAAAPLMVMVERSGSPVLRGYAALALGMIGDRRALEPLRTCLFESANLPGSLQRVSIGLSLLGDTQASPALARLLVQASSPEVQASLAAALGWVRDPTPLPTLTERLIEHTNDLSRAWISVAVGRISDSAPRPWNASLGVGVNYDVALPTLRDVDSLQGVLDYP